MAKQRVRISEPAPPVKVKKRVRLEGDMTTPFVLYTTPFPAFKGDKPTACSKCKHVYWRPCNGKNKNCMNTVGGAVEPPKKKRVRTT